MSKGKLFVISGASGVGKSTVLNKVMAERSDLRFSVSATTRSPRPGEGHSRLAGLLDDAVMRTPNTGGFSRGAPTPRHSALETASRNFTDFST